MGYLILSKALDLCSYSKTDGIYKAPTSLKKNLEYVEALKVICSIMTEDLSISRCSSLSNKADILSESSENMEGLGQDSCDLLVTSPPYLNNFDYAEMARMYFYFWNHARNWKEITEKVRNKLIVNTTTALNGHKDKIMLYRNETPKSVHKTLDSYQGELREKRKIRAGKKEYNFLIYPYFSKISKILKNSHFVLKRGAAMHMIISDSALYGVHIKSQEIIATIMEEIGFENIKIKKLRSRGTRWVLEKREGAKDGLGEYQITCYSSKKRIG